VSASSPPPYCKTPEADGRKGLRPSKNRRKQEILNLEGGNTLPPQGILQAALVIQYRFQLLQQKNRWMSCKVFVQKELQRIV
jgi:hypothetical protein